MTTLELALSILTPLTGGGGALAVYLRSRAAVAKAREESATAVVPQLREMLADERAQRQRERAEDRKACAEELSRAESGCDDRIAAALAPVRAELVIATAELADHRERLMGREDTGVHHLRDTPMRLSQPIKMLPPPRGEEK